MNIILALTLLWVPPTQDEEPITVLLEGRKTKQDGWVRHDGQLWGRAPDVSRVTGFDVKPEGLCRGKICIPLPQGPEWVRKDKKGNAYNLTRISKKLGQAVAVDLENGTWNFGRIPEPDSGLSGGMAPDFALPNLDGKKVRLSQFRGKKVLLLTWASW